MATGDSFSLGYIIYTSSQREAHRGRTAISSSIETSTDIVAAGGA